MGPLHGMLRGHDPQDVDAKGHATYSAWWELIPAPSITISNFPVAAGDHMHAVIAEAAPDANVSASLAGEKSATTLSLDELTMYEEY